ncbi:hypothetical protein ACIQWA_34735 [Kitasatospora sp. NPDC098652]|uniref:hypothetical protein n=1 Tax=Kitasatospora sp. NPDC098652 TaxID=3364095 RepID=UPI003819DCDA
MNSYTFAAWERAGAAASLGDPDDLARTAPVRGQLQPTVAVNGGAPSTLTMEVYGPGDVTAFDPRQIVRLYPRPGTPDAETTRFPLVEFDRTDLPWMFTPLTAGPGGVLRPWLALVCVRAGLRPVRQPGLPLPVLQLGSTDTATELPDPAFLHLWAHTQLVSGDASDPRRSVSRLLAPRRLQPHTDYVACLVPAFEAGRRAGTGSSGGDLAPAWTRGAPATLPVYFSWSFATGDAGDFETLATRLRARPLPPTAGLRPLDVSRPGLLSGSPGALVQQAESALQSPDVPPRTGWPVDAASTAWRQDLATALDSAAHDDGTEDPSILPPLYGGFHALRGSVEPTATGWFDALNLDPRWRVAAGLGTRAVQGEQEALMASAWSQLADAREANRFLDLAGLARLVGVRLHLRHVAALSADAFLHLTAPLRSRTLFGDATLESRIRDSALPAALASAAFRRATRPLGLLSRRVARAAGPGGAEPALPFATVISTVALSPVGLAAPRFEPDGAVAFALPPEGLVSAERLPGVLDVLGLTGRGPQAWDDLAAQALARAAARDVTSDQLARAPAVAEPLLGSTVRLRALPEVAVPAAFFHGSTLAPTGELTFPSGRTAPGGLSPLTGPAAVDGTYTGLWKGPWDTDEDDNGGPWSGDCAGSWSAPGLTNGQWAGTFAATWAFDMTVDDPESVPGTWRAVCTGTWSCDQDNGTWQGVCTGTWSAYEILSDATFSGTWRSTASAAPTARHGSWHGSAPGTWDGHGAGNGAILGNGGIWQARCAGSVQCAVDAGPPPDIPPWTPDKLKDVLAGWQPAAGLPLDRIVDVGYLVDHADGLAAPAVLALGPGDVQAAVVTAHQRIVRAADAPALPPPPPLAVADAHQQVAAALQPAQTVAAVVGARITRPAQADGTGDAPITWAPTFPDPMWRPLAAQSTEWLLAGLADLAPDTATLAVTNPAFVEAYLIGLNHEFGRELRWREYPTDQRGTYFATFWGAGADIPAIPTWDPALPIGGHRPGQPERAVLVLRSALLRRYPGAIVYAAPFVRGEPDDTRARRPVFRGAVDPDTTFLGFDISKDDLLASPWCFVIAEQPSEPRFGLEDVPLAFGQSYQPPPTPDPPTDAGDWNNLSWSYLFDRPEDLDAADYAPGARRPAVALGDLVWGADAAGTARQTFRQPVRVVLPAAALLTPPTPPTPPTGVPG